MTKITQDGKLAIVDGSIPATGEPVLASINSETGEVAKHSVTGFKDGLKNGMLMKVYDETSAETQPKFSGGYLVGSLTRCAGVAVAAYFIRKKVKPDYKGIRSLTKSEGRNPAGSTSGRPDDVPAGTTEPAASVSRAKVQSEAINDENVNLV